MAARIEAGSVIGSAAGAPATQGEATETLRPRSGILSRLKSQAASTSFRPTTLDMTGPEVATAPGAHRFSISFEGLYHSGKIPPDPTIAAGPAHLIQMVNSRLLISTRTGRTLSFSLLSDWWAPVWNQGTPYDPKALYDHHAGRWILHAAGMSSWQTDARYLLAVSRTSDPTGAWCLWALPAYQDGSTNTSYWADFPQVGVDDRAIYITSNQVDPATRTVVYSKLRVIEKAQLDTGTCASSVVWWDFTGLTAHDEDTVQPAVTFGSPGKEYLVSGPSMGGSELTLWSVATSPGGGAPTLAQEAVLPVSPFSVPPDAGQPFGWPALDTVDTRLWNAVYRDGRIFTTFTEACQGSLSCARFVGIDVSSPSVVLDESYGAPGRFTFFPAVMPDGDGNLVAVMERSGPEEFPGSRVAVRPAEATSFGASIALRSGESNYWLTGSSLINRWGDYSGIALDPLDESTVWVFAEHASSPYDHWGTWVGALAASPDHTLVIEGPQGSPNPVDPGQYVWLGVTGIDSLGHDLTYTWSADCPALGTGIVLNVSGAAAVFKAPPNDTGLAQACDVRVEADDFNGLRRSASYRQIILPAPNVVLFSDDMEGGDAGWTVEPPWAITDEAALSGTRSWSDSPSAPYGGWPPPLLTSPAVDISGMSKVTLSHWMIRELEAGDYVDVFAARSGGGLYRELDQISGTWPEWYEFTNDLTSLVPYSPIQILFHIARDDVSPATKDGVHLDDVTVKGLVEPAHAIVVTGLPRAAANPVESGGTSPLQFLANDTLRHPLRGGWTADCPGLPSNGSFHVPTLTAGEWTAPLNLTGSSQDCALSLKLTDDRGLTETTVLTAVVLPDPHVVRLTSGPTAEPNPVIAGGTVELNLSAEDSLGHPLAFTWSASCPDLSSSGTFGDPTVATTIWTAPVNAIGARSDCSIEVTAGDGLGRSAVGTLSQTVLPDLDSDGIEDGQDVCPLTADPAQADLDADGRGDACDNCPADPNPAQSDLDADGAGDACDLTVVSPLDGASLSCDDGPPAVVWTAGRFDQFRVDVSTEPEFRPNHRFTSGKKLIGAGATTWTPPAKKWSRTCRRAGSGSLYVRVYGRVRGSKDTGYSQVVALDVP